MKPPHKIKRVAPEIMREEFNRSQYQTMITRGLFKSEFLRNAHLKDPQKVGEPYCTRSQVLRYKNKSGLWIVEVFQYLRPDNTIGASGQPDPKRLRVRNTVFIADPQA